MRGEGGESWEGGKGRGTDFGCVDAGYADVYSLVFELCTRRYADVSVRKPEHCESPARTCPARRDLSQPLPSRSGSMIQPEVVGISNTATSSSHEHGWTIGLHLRTSSPPLESPSPALSHPDPPTSSASQSRHSVSFARSDGSRSKSLGGSRLVRVRRGKVFRGGGGGVRWGRRR